MSAGSFRVLGWVGFVWAWRLEAGPVLMFRQVVSARKITVKRDPVLTKSTCVLQYNIGLLYILT